MNEVRARIGEQGRIVIPAKYRRSLELEPGDEVVMRVEDDELRIRAARQAVARAKKLVRQYAGKRSSLSKKLIAARRAEAKSG